MHHKTLILLIFLQSGSVIAENYDTGQPLFGYHLEAAKRGNPESMYILGGMYEHGKGTKVDYTEAIKWYTKAASLGNSRALARISEVLKKQRDAIIKRQNTSRIRKTTPKTQLTTTTQKATEPNKDKHIESKLEQEMREAQLLKEQLAKKNAEALKAKEEAERTATLMQQKLKMINLEAEEARRKAKQAQQQQEQLTREREKLKQLQNRLAEQANDQSSEKTQPLPQKPGPAPVNEFKSDPCDGPTAAFMSTCR